MNTSLRLAVFAVLALAQLYVPYAMISRHETILSEGTLVKIRCQPIDPVDLFHGRYVWLSLDMGTARLGAGVALPEQAGLANVTLELDAEGFSRWGEITEGVPETPYVRTTIMPHWSAEGEGVYAEIPVDRFYMNENVAPEAERLYNELVREEPQSCYVAARVHEGVMLLEELYLDDIPMQEYVRQRMAGP